MEVCCRKAQVMEVCCRKAQYMEVCCRKAQVMEVCCRKAQYMEVCRRKAQVMEVCDVSADTELSADALQALLEFDRSQAVTTLLSETSGFLLPGEETEGDISMPTADWVHTTLPPALTPSFTAIQLDVWF